VTLLGNAALSGRSVETFTVPQTTDVLFVVDDSCSMLDKQIALGNTFTSFVGSRTGWQIGVATTDGTAGGQLRGSVLAPSSPNQADLLPTPSSTSSCPMCWSLARAKAVASASASHRSHGLPRQTAGTSGGSRYGTTPARGLKVGSAVQHHVASNDCASSCQRRASAALASSRRSVIMLVILCMRAPFVRGTLPRTKQ
jgi:hypothetical protein